ncbi:hypothetical protein B0H15DRAFT_922227 [Mycena belliarum]|uniref:CID domain-containing protein n=1 Tax=Mycena belliarum TaxID=1033014 RepID=A0AAD6UAA8_9AGAR|nr:hypothetical protein B0H15DRAFT_922227 [Mycena belliae]
MAQLSEFESALKEVVHAKRLSASKMNNLTEIALKSMQDDTQLVSILFRTHKSLQAPAKVSSLYVFDALARAARSQVAKQNLVGDINARKGNCATFLLKVEGVLEGLFQDMMAAATPESKEKTKKVLDIWSKGNTFPSAILVRLKDVVSGETGKDTEVKVTTDPRSAIVTPPAVVQVAPIAPAPVLDPQATLLALLTRAAQNAAHANPGQTTTNNSGAASSSSQQLAVLQQLALTANLGNVPQPSVQPVPVFLSGHSRSPASHREEHYSASPNGARRDSRFDRNNGQDIGWNSEDRSSFRGGFRGRGRGDGRGWDDRDRYRDSERSPPLRARSSRSRSPPSRYAARRDRDVRPYSPPRRPSLASLPHQEPKREGPPASRGIAALEPGKDEFGRDIRPPSPSPEPPADIVAQPPPPPPPPVVRTQTVEAPPAALTSNHDQMSLTPSVDANTSSRAPDAAIVSNKIPPSQGMENFSLATFDFTAASSWEGLGKMWQVTHGFLPSAEQLMEFVMSGGTMVATQAQQQPGWVGGQSWGGNTAGAQPRRGARGRGGFARGRGYGGNFARDGYSDMGQTDAIVLGGGDEDVMMTEGSGPSEKGGRMQRVGEKWVFVRDMGSNEP